MMPYSTYQKIRKKKKKRKSWLIRQFSYYKLVIFRLKSHPRNIARGLAAGTFAGCFPLFGLQIIMAILLAMIIRGNKLAAITGTWISNPFTYIPIFLFNFQIGRLFLLLFNLHIASQHQLELQVDSWAHFKDAGMEIIVTLLIGSLIIGLIVSLIVYFLTLILLAQKKNQKP